MKNIRKKIKNIVYYWPIIPFLLLIVFVELSPVGNIILKSFFTDSGKFGLDNFAVVFSRKIYQVTIINSLKLAFIVTMVGLLIAFLGGIAVSASSAGVKNFFMSILNMSLEFSGIPLAFAFIIILGSSGVITSLARTVNLDWIANFDLYSFEGLILVYVYFEIPLGTLTLLPAFEGIKKEWQESAELMNASRFQFWTRIGVPVLLPSLIGTFAFLFADALTAYATLYALVLNNIPVLPTKIAACFTGESFPKEGLGSALTVVMILIICIVLITSSLLRKALVKGRQSS